MDKAKVEEPTATVVLSHDRKAWRQMNKDRNRQRRYGSALITSKVYMFGERNRPIIATLPSGDTIVSNYKNLEKQGLTHLLSK